MEDKKPISGVIDYDTGEVTDEFYEGDRYRKYKASDSKKRDDYLKTHILGFNKDKSFVKLFDAVIPILNEHLTPPEFKLAICLASHVSHEDCILRKANRVDSSPLDIHDVCKIYGYKYDYCRKLFRKLISKGIIGKHITGSIIPEYDGDIKEIYTVNPYVYFRGINVNASVIGFYKDSGWKDICNGYI